jgi:hypothetical protein
VNHVINGGVFGPALKMPLCARLEWSIGRQSLNFSQVSVLDWLRAQLLLVRARLELDSG